MSLHDKWSSSSWLFGCGIAKIAAPPMASTAYTWNGGLSLSGSGRETDGLDLVERSVCRNLLTKFAQPSPAMPTLRSSSLIGLQGYVESLISQSPDFAPLEFSKMYVPMVNPRVRALQLEDDAIRRLRPRNCPVQTSISSGVPEIGSIPCVPESPCVAVPIPKTSCDAVLLHGENEMLSSEDRDLFSDRASKSSAIASGWKVMSTGFGSAVGTEIGPIHPEYLPTCPGVLCEVGLTTAVRRLPTSEERDLLGSVGMVSAAEITTGPSELLSRELGPSFCAEKTSGTLDRQDPRDASRATMGQIPSDDRVLLGSVGRSGSAKVASGRTDVASFGLRHVATEKGSGFILPDSCAIAVSEVLHPRNKEPALDGSVLRWEPKPASSLPGARDMDISGSCAVSIKVSESGHIVLVAIWSTAPINEGRDTLPSDDNDLRSRGQTFGEMGTLVEVFRESGCSEKGEVIWLSSNDCQISVRSKRSAISASAWCDALCRILGLCRHGRWAKGWKKVMVAQWEWGQLLLLPHHGVSALWRSPDHPWPIASDFFAMPDEILFGNYTSPSLRYEPALSFDPSYLNGVERANQLIARSIGERKLSLTYLNEIERMNQQVNRHTQNMALLPGHYLLSVNAPALHVQVVPAHQVFIQQGPAPDVEHVVANEPANPPGPALPRRSQLLDQANNDEVINDQLMGMDPELRRAFQEAPCRPYIFRRGHGRYRRSESEDESSSDSDSDLEPPAKMRKVVAKTEGATGWQPVKKDHYRNSDPDNSSDEGPAGAGELVKSPDSFP